MLHSGHRSVTKPLRCFCGPKLPAAIALRLPAAEVGDTTEFADSLRLVMAAASSAIVLHSGAVGCCCCFQRSRDDIPWFAPHGVVLLGLW